MLTVLGTGPPATIVSIGQGSALSVTNGARGTLTALVLPSGHTDGEVSWTSSATNFVTIDASSGAYRAVGIGTATITASVGNVTDTITITVEVHSIPATNIAINGSNFTTNVGDTGQLMATLQPANSTDSYLWSSSATNIVSIVSNTGIWTARDAGTATITAQVVGKHISNSITVTVKRPATNIAIDQGATLQVANGATGTLTATVLPTNHTDNLGWSSSDTNKVMINASSGAYTAAGAGTVTITATAGQQMDTITITVPRKMPIVSGIGTEVSIWIAP